MGKQYAFQFATRQRPFHKRKIIQIALNTKNCCLRPTAEGLSNYFSCCSCSYEHLVNLLLGCTSSSNQIWPQTQDQSWQCFFICKCNPVELFTVRQGNSLQHVCLLECTDCYGPNHKDQLNEMKRAGWAQIQNHFSNAQKIVKLQICLILNLSTYLAHHHFTY